MHGYACCCCCLDELASSIWCLKQIMLNWTFCVHQRIVGNEFIYMGDDVWEYVEGIVFFLLVRAHMLYNIYAIDTNWF